MSIFKYMFDNDWQQRRDIEELRDQQYRLAVDRVGSSSGGASEKWDLMQLLAEKGGLDVAEVERRVDEELEPPAKVPKAQRQAKPSRAVGTTTDETCTKCAVGDRSTEMVRAGSAWFCRPCARNP